MRFLPPLLFVTKRGGNESVRPFAIAAIVGQHRWPSIARSAIVVVDEATSAAVRDSSRRPLRTPTVIFGVLLIDAIDSKSQRLISVLAG